jgi:peptidoglycan/LPS O-acetylase OafA/YrhL
VVIACVPWLRVLLQSSMAYPGLASYVLTPTRADALALGVLTAVLVRNPVFWTWLQSQRHVLWATTAFFFLGIAYMTWQGYGALSYPMTTWGFSWLALFYTCVLLVAVTSTEGSAARALQTLWLRRLGAIAYCSYLVHVAFMNALRHPLKAHFPQYPVVAWLAGGILGTALTLAVAALSYKYLEKPLLRRAHEYSY